MGVLKNQSPFSIFEIKPTVEVDLSSLEKKYYEKCRQFHPDRISRSDQTEVLKNQKITAEINEAYSQLKDSKLRLEALLIQAGIETDIKIEIPTELAEEFFEIQELSMKSDEPVFKEAEQFLEKIKKLSTLKLSEAISLAKKIDWSKNQIAQTYTDEIQEIKYILSYRNYLNSLVSNTEKLIQASREQNE